MACGLTEMILKSAHNHAGMRCFLLLLLLLTACASVSETRGRAQESVVPDAPVEPQSAPSESPVEPQPRATALDCLALVTDADMQGACSDVAAEEFLALPTESGCSYIKGINSLNADVSIPEVGTAQVLENMALNTNTWTGVDPETLDVGVTAYYGSMASFPHVWFVKGEYFVDVFSPLCGKEQLTALAAVVAGRLP